MRVTVVVCLAGAALAIAVAAGFGTSATRTSVVDGCFAFKINVADTSVRAGHTVSFAVAARNVADHGCTGRSCSGVTPTYEVRDLAARVVYSEGSHGVSCARTAPPPPNIATGATVAWDAETWDGRDDWQGTCSPGNCNPTRPLAPPGEYQIIWYRVPGDVAVPSMWFRYG